MAIIRAMARHREQSYRRVYPLNSTALTIESIRAGITSSSFCPSSPSCPSSSPWSSPPTFASSTGLSAEAEPRANVGWRTAPVDAPALWMACSGQLS
jgi:hypothetical protein